MAMLTKDQIFSVEDIKTESVPVPEWGGDVLVREMCGSDRDAFEAFVMESNKSGSYRNMRARLVALTVVDDKNKRLFSDSDIERLGQKGAKALSRIFEVAQRLNGIGEQAAEAAAGN